jgi:UDP-N-acetyl-D-mannosaminuronic acid transferase (WecB/TagA/CpsF family)
LVAVRAGFDFHAGATPQAPIQFSDIDWFFRTMTDRSG